MGKLTLEPRNIANITLGNAKFEVHPIQADFKNYALLLPAEAEIEMRDIFRIKELADSFNQRSIQTEPLRKARAIRGQLTNGKSFFLALPDSASPLPDEVVSEAVNVITQITTT